MLFALNPKNGVGTGNLGNAALGSRPVLLISLLTSVFGLKASGLPRLALALLLGCAGLGTTRAAGLAVGDAVPAFSAKDQFGKEFKFAPGVRFLVLGFDMSAAEAGQSQARRVGRGLAGETGRGLCHGYSHDARRGAAVCAAENAEISAADRARRCRGPAGSISAPAGAPRP